MPRRTAQTTAGMDRGRESRRGVGTVRSLSWSLSRRRAGGKGKVRPQRISRFLRNFLDGCRVYVIDAKKMTFGSIASFAIYSRTTKPRFYCGFVDFFGLRLISQ